MKLLAADLRALSNLPATVVGRRMTFGLVIGLGLLALMSWWLARAILESPHLARMIQEQGGDDTALGMFGYGLMACPMVATWLGLATAQRQLFETPELMLWRQAPIPAFRGPVQVFVRSVFVSTLWASALSGPFVIALLQKSPAGWTAYALLPAAIVSCTAPLLATLLAVQIIMVRFLSGRWLRLVLSAVAALASVGFTVWLLLNLFTTGRERLQEVADASGSTLPPTVHAAAMMLANAAKNTLAFEHVLPVALWTSGSLAVFGIAALLHSRAHERFLESDRPLWRRSTRPWPTSLASNVRKKEFAQVLQQPGALIGFVVFAVLVFALANKQVLVGNILSSNRIPHEARNIAAMLSWWFLAVLLVLYAHMGRLALWDGAQWPLYMASPAKPGWILRGKLQAIAVFLMWPLLLVCVAGAHILKADGPTMLWFLGFALAGTLAALGVVAIVGTWPRLMRPDNEGQILQGGKSFLAAMVMVTLFQITMTPAIFGWRKLSNEAQRSRLTSEMVHDALPSLLGIALGYAALIAIVGFLLGGRNYRNLLAPR